MTQIKPFKFVVQAVMIKTDNDKVLDELTATPVTVYGLEGLAEYTKQFPGELKKLNADLEKGV